MILGGLIVSPLPEVLAGFTRSLEFFKDSLLRLIEPLLFCRLCLGGDLRFIVCATTSRDEGWLCSSNRSI